jgi:hypothetical protein
MSHRRVRGKIGKVRCRIETGHKKLVMTGYSKAAAIMSTTAALPANMELRDEAAPVKFAGAEVVAGTEVVTALLSDPELLVVLTATGTEPVGAKVAELLCVA